MWTRTTREQYKRPTTRYQSDLTDAEWAVIEPYLPLPNETGRPWGWPLREIVNAIFYVLRSGCPWRQMPSDLPPWETVYRWFGAWRDDCLFERINHALVMADRERVGREASPSAAIIDSQSVKTTEAGGPRGGACPRAGGAGPGGRRQEDQGPQASCPGRHRRPRPPDRAASGRHPGSRRRRGAAVRFAQALPVHHLRLRRHRLRPRTGNHGHQHHRRDRAKAEGSGRLRRPAATLGGRALLRLARPQPQARQRL